MTRNRQEEAEHANAAFEAEWYGAEPDKRRKILDEFMASARAQRKKASAFWRRLTLRLLRKEVLAMEDQAQQAGRMALDLFVKNEALEAKLQLLTANPGERLLYWAPRDDLNRALKEIDVLKEQNAHLFASLANIERDWRALLDKIDTRKLRYD